MKWRWLLWAGLALLGVGVWLFASRPARILAVRGTQLGSSLSRATDGTGGQCRLQKDREWWWCGVETDPGSGIGQTFRLTSEASGCWEATEAEVHVIKRAPGSPYPKLVRVTPTAHPDRPSGCIGLLDYVIPDQLYGGNGRPDYLPLR